ncbi:hypothetical protein ABIB25_001360 [Nakamurella sp. UYEF19]
MPERIVATTRPASGVMAAAVKSSDIAPHGRVTVPSRRLRS